MTTVGNASDYKHFLPRIIELSVEGDCPHMGTRPIILADKINCAGRQDWPSDEQSAVAKVFEAAWKQALELNPDESDNAEDWLCAVLSTGGSIDVELDFWLSCPLIGAGLQLARAVQSDVAGEADRPGWENLPVEALTTFLSWLASDAVRERLKTTLPVAGEHAGLVDRALDKFRARH